MLKFVLKSDAATLKTFEVNPVQQQRGGSPAILAVLCDYWLGSVVWPLCSNLCFFKRHFCHHLCPKVSIEADGSHRP